MRSIFIRSKKAHLRVRIVLHLPVPTLQHVPSLLLAVDTTAWRLSLDAHVICK
jgi:hypothetical protein